MTYSLTYDENGTFILVKHSVTLCRLTAPLGTDVPLGIDTSFILFLETLVNFQHFVALPEREV